jgi:hypothetical protein
VEMSAHPTKNSPVATARGKAGSRKPRTHARLPLTIIGRAYERFLELPVVFVLAVLWMMGVALLGSIALVLYLSVRVLLQLVAGSI